MLYDLFICHASEDKRSFVRRLADALTKENVAVWYDEFSLKLGDSIRRSLDKGLRQSRFGVVVLSKAFFRKQWPQYELDGLAEREVRGHDKVILPVWHGVTYDDIFAYSPALAGRKAVSSDESIGKVVDEILDVVRPQGSPLIAARDRLLEWGLTPPVITDEYWLNIVEASNRLPGYGVGIPEETCWNRWSFPLPPKGETAEDWGERLAWTAMQYNWVADADRIPICLITHPAEVLAFIDDHPGLRETCTDFPGLVAEYAPQLTIPGMGGPLESVFQEEYEKSCAKYERRRQIDSRSGTALTTDGETPLCDEEWCLRSPTFGNYDSIHVSYEYFSGREMFGPRVAHYEHPDHAFWLLSEASGWLPEKTHEILLDGMRRWITWPWGDLRDDKGGEWETCGALSAALCEAVDGKRFRWTDKRRDDARNRIRVAIDRMGLPDTVDYIFDRFLQQQFVANYIKTEKKNRGKQSEQPKRATRQKKTGQRAPGHVH